MTDTSYRSGGDDDLPRTVRQQKEARARDQAAREILNAPRATAARGPSSSTLGNHLASDFLGDDFPAAQAPPGEYPAATVKRIELPFLHMVFFFLKVVIAAIPALILLTAILWGVGQIAKHFLPWLIQMKIDLTFPR